MTPTVFNQTLTPHYSHYHGDAIMVARGLPGNSVHLVVTSPPYGDQYVYNDNIRDASCSDSDEEMIEHCSYLARELYRVTVPGRLCAMDCKDRQRYKSRFGKTGLWDFPGELVRMMEHCNCLHHYADRPTEEKPCRQSWQYHSRVTLWRDPVQEMQRTKTQRLLHKQVSEDSSLSGIGQPQYLLLFRKWPETPDEAALQIPITRRLVDSKGRPYRFTSYVGADAPTARPGEERNYSIDVWQRYASPVWHDIDWKGPGANLNVSIARSDQDEKHLCPLALQICERAIEIWSNPGEVVLDPFAGVCSVGYQAILQGRRFVGSELKESYYQTGLSYLREAVEKVSTPTLFSGMGLGFELEEVA